MKINFDEIDRESFLINQHFVAGELCYLIQPKHMGANWTKDNLIFRSSLWNSQGELISASFPKFFNWGEKPELTYTPFSLTANGGCELMEKIDGSTLIVSKYKNHVIVRTRGTVDATSLDNGHEIEFLKNKYPKVFDFGSVETYNGSWIYEWVSPLNRIVLDYGSEPDLYLIGHINHDDYKMEPQTLLNASALYLGVKRPKMYSFTSIKEMLSTVEEMEDKEGICCYCNRGQSIRKIKSARYLMLHRLKSELSSIEKVLDLWIDQGCMEYQEFYNYICNRFDFELANQCRGNISKICDAYKEVSKIKAGMSDFLNKNCLNVSRKEAALKITKAYGETNRASFCFKMLDGKDFGPEEIKKLIFQIVKK